MKPLAAIVGLILALPTLSWSAPMQVIDFRGTEEDGYVEFSAAGASGVDYLTYGYWVGYWVTVDGKSVELEVCDSEECDSLHVELAWEVGPLLGFEPYPAPDLGVFRYGGGTLRLDISASTLERREGFSAPIRSLTIDLVEHPAYERWYKGKVTALLGPGILDPLLATLLGTSRRTTGGSYLMGTDASVHGAGETFDGWGSDEYGTGPTLFVPEPGLVSLLTASAVSFVLVRRRRTRG